MAVTAQILVKGVTLSASLTSVYTVAAGTILTNSAVVSNPTSEAVSIAVTIQRADGSQWVIIPGRAVAAGATDLLPELARTLITGDQILASGAGLNLIVDGFSM